MSSPVRHSAERSPARRVKILHWALYAGVLALELLAAVFLAREIRARPRQMAASIGFVSKTSVVHPPESSFKHFTEPRASSTVQFGAPPPWLREIPRITINRDSLNERYDYSAEKPLSTYRIVTLGDSWTFGQYLNTEENYPEQLEDLLNRLPNCSGTRFEVVNLGVYGYDIQFSVERFRRRGVKYHPDLVIWLLISNDFDEIAEFIEEHAAAYREPVFRELGDQAALSPSAWARLAEGVADAYRKARNDLYARYREEDILEFQSQALTQISAHYGGNLLLVTLPGASIVKDSYRDILREFARERTHTYIRENPAPFGEPETLLPDGHPNAAGYARIAADLAAYLRTQNLIPCSP